MNRDVGHRRRFGHDVLGGRAPSNTARISAAVALCLSAITAHAGAQPPDDDLPTPDARDESTKPSKEERKQAIAPAKNPESTNLIVPLVMYTPETHVGFGGLFVHFFRLTKNMPESRVSSLGFLALVTTRRQAIFEIHPDLYWSSDNFRLYGKVEYQRYPDSFWGIGNDTPDDAEERYERERARVRAGAQQRFYRSLHAGLATDVMYYDAQYPDPDGIFATQDVPGEGGGFTAGIGPTITLDNRDNAIATHSGTLLHLSSLWFGPYIGSRYTFRKLALDARQFFPVTDTHTLGVHFYGETQGGDVPYYQLAMLGGDELLRGYYLGRYRDKNLLALDVEYRLPIYWRFGAVVFGGAGQVADHLLELPTAPVRWAVGGGLRVALNPEEGLNLRLDFGIGPGTHGFYFTAREAF